MRVIFFSESQKLIKIINDICISKDTSYQLLPISYDNIRTLTLTSKEDIYIIDDACYATLDQTYLSLLKSLKVDVIVLVKELSELAKYMDFNVIEYMYGSFKPFRMRLCLDRLYKRNMLLSKRCFNSNNDKILIRNRNDVTVVKIKDISYIKAFVDSVQVYIGREVLISTDSMTFFESMTSHAFFRIAKDIIVNFEKVYHINKESDDCFRLKIMSCEQDLVMTDYISGQEIEDSIQKKRVEYLVETLENKIN